MDEEELMNEAQAAGSQPQAIEISFNTNDPAWDDRELISGFDDAMEQFRLMNPGPGTMLDKMMAAAARGEELNGYAAAAVATMPAIPRNLIRTRWYTSAIPPPTPGSSSSRSGVSAAAAAASGYDASNPSTMSASTTSNSNKKKKQNKKARLSNAGGGGQGAIKRVWDEDGNVMIESRLGGANGIVNGSSSWIDGGQSASKRVRTDPATSSAYTTEAVDEIYDGPASPSYTPASPSTIPAEVPPVDDDKSYAGAGPRLPAHLEQSRVGGSTTGAGSGNPYRTQQQQQQQQQQQPRSASSSATQTARTHHGRPMPQTQSADRRTRPATGDSTSNDYEPTATGVYPEMGTGSGVALRMGGFSISREEAAMRAVNAQWWAGYWYAMSEVLPSAEQ